MSSIARFNPRAGIVDFWHEFRKPNPLRLPILVLSLVPAGVIFYWLNSETAYKDPEQPSITYIDSYGPDRTDDEIIASNLRNQEVKELREAQLERVAERKRDMYKALGAAAGMDVDKIAEEADARKAQEEAEAAERRAEVMERAGANAQSSAPAQAQGRPQAEGSTP